MTALIGLLVIALLAFAVPWHAKRRLRRRGITLREPWRPLLNGLLLLLAAGFWLFTGILPGIRYGHWAWFPLLAFPMLAAPTLYEVVKHYRS